MIHQIYQIFIVESECYLSFKIGQKNQKGSKGSTNRGDVQTD